MRFKRDCPDGEVCNPTFDVEPDLIVMSKSIAAGLPLSAITGRAEVMEAPEPGQLGGTFGGSPISCGRV